MKNVCHFQGEISTKIVWVHEGFYWLIQLLFPVLLIWAIVQLWRKYHTESTKCLNLPPGNFGWPFIGETLPFLSNGRQYFRTRISRHGKIFTSHLLGRPTVVICDPKAVQQVLTTEHILVQNHSPPGIQRLIGPGSLCCTLDFNIHRTKQRAFRKAFSHDFMERCIPTVQSVFRKQMASWLGQRYANGVHDLKMLTLQITLNVLLGFKVSDPITSRLSTLFNTYNDSLLCLPINLPGSTFRKAIKSRTEIIHVIQEAFKNRKANTNGFSNVLDTIMMGDEYDASLKENSPQAKCNPGATPCKEVEPELMDMILELMVASQSTLSSTCCALIIHMALNKEVVDSIREELVHHRQEGCHGNTLSYLMKLNFVNDVIKEVLRVSPPVAGGFRQTKQTLTLEGYSVPKGWGILYCITDTHENTETFPQDDRLEFNPKRWQNLRQKSTDKMSTTEPGRFEYIPFGGGARKCVGREFALLFLRLFIVELCMTCDWQLKNGNVMPAMKTDPIPFPMDGLPLHISSAQV